MKTVVTVGDMRRLEQAAVDQGTSYATLMERAGTAASAVFEQRFADASHVLILCGNGNNGGDGFVMARKLVSASRRVTVLLVSGEAKTELACAMFAMLDERVTCITLPQESAQAVNTLLDDPLFNTVTHVVDAVYGIGFHAALPLPCRVLFDRVRQWRCPVLAVDVPSGVRADDGTWDKAALRAEITVTFTALKPCAVLEECAECCGETVVASVGIDEALCRSFETVLCPIDDSFLKQSLPHRVANSHKGTYGRLLSVCGSYGMAGAAVLSGRAALRMGLGLLYAAIPASVYPILAGSLLEAVYHPLDETENGSLTAQLHSVLSELEDGKDALLVGCGLSRDPQTVSLLREWVPQAARPLLLDADGLNAFSGHILLLKARKFPTVITPHPAEAARLLESSVAAVERDRFAAVKQLAAMTGAVTVLKGHRTLIAVPNGCVYLNVTGCSGLATGGSGDVLSGMIASLLAQKLSAEQAACCGVYLHGKTSEVTALRLSETAMLPSDMLEDLASLLSQYEVRE